MQMKFLQFLSALKWFNLGGIKVGKLGALLAKKDK